jgi:probable rRNA maturation factor
MPLNKSADLEYVAEKLLTGILKKAQRVPKLKKKLPKAKRKAVHFVLVGEPQMKRLNFAWRAKKFSTDILSFPTPALFFKQGEMGELIVCLPILKKQAREQRHPVERELEILLVHGVLHLLGFDHELGAKHAKEMKKWEDALLKRDGLISRVAKGTK